MRYATRRDLNHDPIEEVFRVMLGDHVTNIAGLGGGVGDLAVSYGPYLHLIEIKRDAKVPLTAAEIKFKKTHPGCITRVENVAQAENICRIIRARGMMLAEGGHIPRLTEIVQA